jgi:hypothetical protein
MFEDFRLVPLHILPSLYHLREQEAMMFIENLGRVVTIFANSMRMANILSPVSPCYNPPNRKWMHTPLHTNTQK